MVKPLRQVAGVQKVKVIDFKKGLFAVTPKKGVRLSEDALASAIVLSGFTLSKIVSPEKKISTEPKGSKTPADEIDKLLAPAKNAFHRGDFSRAWKLANALSHRLQSPNANSDKKTFEKSKSRYADAMQFLSLVSFSLKKYEEAAEQAHLGLHKSTPWNWKTLSGHYKNSDDYNSQLRSLEKSIRSNSSTEKRFLIGYHYLMQGHKDAARKQLELAQKEQPQNEVIRILLKNLAARQKR